MGASSPSSPSQPTAASVIRGLRAPLTPLRHFIPAAGNGGASGPFTLKVSVDSICVEEEDDYYVFEGLGYV